jgi:hypothetical protein
MKATQDMRVTKAARQEVAVDATDVLEATVKVLDAIREALEAAQAWAKLDSLWFDDAHACDSVLDTPSNRAPLITQVGEISGRLERVVPYVAFFGAQTVLSVVISYYDGIDLPSISQGFASGWSDKEIDTFEVEVTPVAQSLARLVSPEAVLQALEEGKK